MQLTLEASTMRAARRPDVRTYVTCVQENIEVKTRTAGEDDESFLVQSPEVACCHAMLLTCSALTCTSVALAHVSCCTRA